MTATAGGSASPSSGLFLVLEGTEGVGKTTQARLLGEWLEELGVRHRLAREPGGTEVGEAIREVLLHRGEMEMPPETELLLMLAARAAYVRQVVRPALDEGLVVVSDRFELSTLAYQGAGRGVGVERARELNAFATGGLRPHLTVVLDLPVSEGRARKAREGEGRDRIEGEDDAFLERVAGAYRRLAGEEGDAVLVDASSPPDRVHLRIREILEARFPEPFRGGRG